MNLILNNLNPDFNNIGTYGLLVALIGYLVVFSALLSLYFVFSQIPLLLNLKLRFNLRKQGKECAEKKDFSVTGEVNAAISMALYLYLNEMHDKESNVITINKVSKSYSAWSSKVYVLRGFRK